MRLHLQTKLNRVFEILKKYALNESNKIFGKQKLLAVF